MLKNVIFDIGEVLLSYRWNYVLEVSGLSEEEGERVGKLIFADPIWNDLDAGKVTLDEARKMYADKYPKDAKSIAFFLDHPELMPLPREEVWEKLKELRAAGYKTYILSNYGKELFEMHVGSAPFLKDMDGGVISYQVHVCKPDAKIYRKLIEKYGLIPEECLFFDDRIENVNGAIACGMQSMMVTSEAELIRIMNTLIQQATVGDAAESAV
ncbi:MAG: HAD family phosphatase [Lachnospiraceae bacterium]|nr:HAD family phosphatase [Parasporobacterium sp.]MBR4168156.1 HAD family phosphatase [Lachnospiraceae bacterium]